MIEIELRRVIKHMANWGFDLLDPMHASSPGGRLMLVAMRRLPTNDHYDPEKLTVLLDDERGALGPVTLNRHARFARPSKVRPGHIYIADRVGKRLDFYGFGGVLTVVRVTEFDPHFTLFIIESPAPLMALNGVLGHRVEDQLVDSAEALYARLRARHASERLDMAQLLSQIPPLSLYAACIESMWRMYRRSPALPTVFAEFYRLLGREHHWLSGLDGTGPAMIPLEAVLDEHIARVKALDT